MTAIEYTRHHWRIMAALMARELATRYGRNNIGFLWIMGEPLLFGGGVLFVWSLIRAPYEHGLKLVPFLVTGYFPLLMIRHTLSQGMNCFNVNANLLYHRSITLLHLFISRMVLEVIGVTFAMVVVVVILIFFGAMEPPASLMIIYAGWLLLAWLTVSLALVFSSINALYEPFEKIGGLFAYILAPVSGMFFMAAWLPYQYRELALKIPLLSCVEMIRKGFFGDSVTTYFHIPYVIAFASILTFTGLILIRIVRDRFEVE